MELKFKSLHALIKAMPDDETARHYFEAHRWNGCPVCPHCSSDNYSKLTHRKRYRCKDCRKDYTVTTGTVFHKSHIPLNVWFAAMYIASGHKTGISSAQLARDLGVTQKTAWFMLHRLRAMMKRPPSKTKLSGIVEIDETYMGRRFHTETSKQPLTLEWYRMNNNYSSKSKGAVFGIIQRGGDIIVKAYNGIQQHEILADIRRYVAKHTWVCTDGSNLYKGHLQGYKHESVIHSRREYVKGDIHTNNVENFWGIMKRGIYGIYHQVSYKHLQRYCDEFAFRHNHRKLDNYVRFELSLNNTGKPLPYKQLISPNAQPEEETYYTEEKNEWD